MVDIEKIKNYYKNAPLNLNDNIIDFDLFNLLVKSKNDIENLVLDIINTGYIKKQTYVKFNYDDTDNTLFLLLEKKIMSFYFSIIIKVINDDNYQLVSVFPVAETKCIHNDGCYFPNEYEIYGRMSSSIGLRETDIFDPFILFERYYFENPNSDDVDWNIFGIACSNDTLFKKYNDNDGIDEICPFRKVPIHINGIDTYSINGIEFFKCYADAALFLEFSSNITDGMGIKIPVYISEKCISSINELYDGKEMDIIIFGNIQTLN